MRPLLGRYPAEEEHVVALPFTDRVLVQRQAVIDRRDPVEERNRQALRVADRHEMLRTERVVDREELGQIQPPVQRRHHRWVGRPTERQRHEVEVRVHDVEVREAVAQEGELAEVRRDALLGPARAERHRRHRYQLGLRARVAAREERDLVTLPD